MTVKFEKDAIKRISEATIGFVALTIGGLIYIQYRSESLLMFDWFQDLNISDFIASIRSNSDNSNLYGWVIYNLPAGLWLFAYMLIIDAIWGNAKNAQFMCHLFILPILAIVSELMQCLGVLPGTFDFLDLISYVCVIILFIIIKKV